MPSEQPLGLNRKYFLQSLGSRRVEFFDHSLLSIQVLEYLSSLIRYLSLLKNRLSLISGRLLSPSLLYCAAKFREWLGLYSKMIEFDPGIGLHTFPSPIPWQFPPSI